MNAFAPISARPRVAAFVPAKGTSERIAGKNLQILDGDHMFRRKLRQLIACPLIDTVYLGSFLECRVRVGRHEVGIQIDHYERLSPGQKVFLSFRPEHGLCLAG